MMERVHYEISFKPSQAAYARLGEALFVLDAQVLSTSLVLHGVVIAIVAVVPHRADEFASRVGTLEMRYRSPTWFDNGSIRPHYASPEEELRERAREQAMKRAGSWTEAFYEVRLGYDGLSISKPGMGAGAESYEIVGHAIGYEKGRPYVAANYMKLPVLGGDVKEGLTMGMLMLVSRLARVFQEKMEKQWTR